MTRTWRAAIGDLDDDEARDLLTSLPIADVGAIAAHWPSWAHRGQLPDPNDPKAESWRTWVIMAGRGFGKTLAGAQWLTGEIARHAGSADPLGIATGEPLAIALVGATLEDARRVMVEGRSGLLTVAADWIAHWHPSLNQLLFTTGATATLFSGASPNRLRGPEHHLAWCDELAKWERGADSWDMLQLGLRLGTRPRALITTTPRAGPLLRTIIADPDTLTTGGSTTENPHISAAYKARVHDLYAGTRLGRQELDGELLTDTPGALWTVELLEKCRLLSGQNLSARLERSRETMPPTAKRAVLDDARNERAGGDSSSPPNQSPTFTRIAIGVDPPSGDGTCGIIACALDTEGTAHVLADHSVTARTPEGWATAVATAAAIHGRYYPLSHRGEDATQNPPLDFEGRGTVPDLIRDGGGAARALARAENTAPIPVQIIAETNQGGRMVKAILHTADPNLHVKPVTASLSKSDRAAPIAHLFEAGKVRLHGRFPELEAQLCGLIAGGGYEGPGASPDRADAMVWALTELMMKGRAGPRVRGV